MFRLSITHETAAGHHQGSSLAALISAKGRDDMSLDFIASAHLKESVEEGYRDHNLEVCIRCEKP